MGDHGVLGPPAAPGPAAALLAGAYLSPVTAAQAVLPLPADSPLAVAASTLAVAALFRSVWGRVQRLVDRRFNRARYDAERVVATYRERLRAGVELEAVSDDPLSAVAVTVQPNGREPVAPARRRSHALTTRGASRGGPSAPMGGSQRPSSMTETPARSARSANVSLLLCEERRRARGHRARAIAHRP